MTPSITVSQPVLVYTRIAQNRRRTVLLLAISVLALVPFVVGISYLVSLTFMRQFVPPTTGLRAHIEREEAYHEAAQAEATDEYQAESEARYQRHIAKERAYLAKHEAEDPELMMEMMVTAGVAVTAALALLYWGIARSPTAKLLSAAGAWPAGSGEEAAVRLVENLAIGAGLPPPKLYVIETNTPNAFAAGMNPEHAVVAVTRGALKLLDRRELEGVLAHELSHIGNRDIRLNTIAASVALFLRIPYLLYRRRVRFRVSVSGILALPLLVYILAVAPMLGALLRAAISREREFLADADAALLTRFPEGLMRALAKIGGAGSSQPNSNPAFSHFYFANPAVTTNWFSGSLMATHPRIENRIERLLAFSGGSVALPALEAAVKEGRQYSSARAAMEAADRAHGVPARDELDHLNRGNPMGRVFRVISSEPVPLYDDVHSGYAPAVTARIKPGALIVVFDDPGKMRQVNTADETFGYIDRSVKLVQLDNVIPAEIYDPKIRAAVEAKLPPLDAVLAGTTPQAAVPSPDALTSKHIVIAVAVFVGVMVVALLVLKFVM
ncbi:MAG: M48 family metalloprotease [Bryobacteraceae bacterium]|jgi:heat shock protein HtpX